MLATKINGEKVILIHFPDIYEWLSRAFSWWIFGKRVSGVAETLSFSWVLSFSPWVLSFVLFLVILCNPWHFLLEMHQIFGENIKIYCFSSKTVFYGMFFDRIRYYQDILSRYFLKSLPKPWVFDMSYWIFLELWVFWSEFFQNVKKVWCKYCVGVVYEP